MPYEIWVIKTNRLIASYHIFKIIVLGQDTGIPGYQDTRIQGYQDIRIPGYQDTGISGY